MEQKEEYVFIRSTWNINNRIMQQGGDSFSFDISGLIVDVVSEKIVKGVVIVKDGVIVDIEEREDVNSSQIVMPGFVDSHVHIESSMLLPTEFARAAVRNGVVAAMADPHEIANVDGVDGVRFMMDNADKAYFKFFFGVPSCVPAAPFDMGGAVIGVNGVSDLLADKRVTHLAEMMNYPGVIHGDPDVMGKLSVAKKLGKPVDGHAPGLSGQDLVTYIKAGISTDHEVVDICEAEEKISLGMKVQIREGSAGKSFDILCPLVNQYPSHVMFCTDDCHPDDLLNGTINLLVKRGLKKGLNFFNLLKAATVNAVEHYGLNVGLLRKGDPADFIVVNNLDDFDVQETYINGRRVYSSYSNFSVAQKEAVTPINNFSIDPISISDIQVKGLPNKKLRVIEAIDRDLYTHLLVETPTLDEDGNVVSNVDQDILKIVVCNRYEPMKPAVGFIKGFGFKRGAICSSVAHDSHNIVAIGADDIAIVEVVNMLIDKEGGIGAHDGKSAYLFALPVGGIMSMTNAESAASAYDFIQEKARLLGTSLTAPFMTMAFMSLIVIPELKLASRGLFDVAKFEPVDLFV